MTLLYQPSSRSELVLAQHLFSLLSTQLHSTLDDYIVFLVLKLSSKAPRKPSYRSVGAKRGEGALCVHIDFTRTFQTNDKYNNVNYVWSHICKILVILKYHRHPWVNIFDTDISRCINTYIKVVYLAFFGIFMLLKMSVSKILAQGRLWYFKATNFL